MQLLPGSGCCTAHTTIEREFAIGARAVASDSNGRAAVAMRVQPLDRGAVGVEGVASLAIMAHLQIRAPRLKKVHVEAEGEL